MSTGLNLVADIGSRNETAMACPCMPIDPYTVIIQYNRARTQWREFSCEYPPPCIC